MGVDLLKKALDLYLKKSNYFGIGKTILRLAKLYLDDNIYWTDEILPYDHKKLKELIKESI